MPLVSVLLPSYNAAKYLAAAINSVLSQTFADFELLIINDGSTDNTAAVISSFSDPRLKVFINPRNFGIQKALNTGLAQAAGKYIARIDADDEWLDKDKLTKQVAFLENNPDHVLVGTGAIVADENNWEIFRYLNAGKDADIRKRLLGRNQFIHPSVLFRKEAALAAGGYSESKDCRHAEDYDLWLKLGRIGKFANLPDYAIRYRQSAGQISEQNRLDQIETSFALIQKYRNDYPGFMGARWRYAWRYLIYGYLKWDWLKKITARHQPD